MPPRRAQAEQEDFDACMSACETLLVAVVVSGNAKGLRELMHMVRQAHKAWVRLRALDP